MKRKYILELDDKYLPVYKACEVLDIRFSELTELVCCKDCIKKDICADYMFSQQEEGYCAWAARNEE